MVDAPQMHEPQNEDELNAVLDEAAHNGHCAIIAPIGVLVVPDKTVASQLFLIMIGKLSRATGKEIMVCGAIDPQKRHCIAVDVGNLVLHGVSEDEFVKVKNEIINREKMQ
jgi:hypothetical protein